MCEVMEEQCNSKLRAGGHSEMITEELVAGRLYTGVSPLPARLHTGCPCDVDLVGAQRNKFRTSFQAIWKRRTIGQLICKSRIVPALGFVINVVRLHEQGYLAIGHIHGRPYSLAFAQFD